VADVLRLDTAASFNADSPSYPVGAGTDRGLIVGLEHEGAITPDSVSITWGGQAMTQLVTEHVEAAGNDQEVVLFLLLEAGIAAGAGTTIVVTGEAVNFTIHAASYENVNQGGGTDSVPETNSAGTTGATPNPLTTSDIVAGDGAAVVALAGVGNATTATWGADLTEQTEQINAGTATCTGSLADGLFATGQNVDVEATWASQNRAAVIAIELAPTEDGNLSGSIALALTPTGALEALANIQGSSDLVITATGAVAVTVPIAGSSDMVLTPSAVLSGEPPPSIWYKSGEVVTPASGNSVVDVTDKGEDPFGIHLSWTDNTADQTIQTHAELGHGFSDGTNHRAVMHNAQDGASNNLRQSSITAAILVVDPTDDTILVEGSVTFQATTFTLVFTTVAAGFRIHYEVFGGSGAAIVADVGADAAPVTGLGLANGDLLLGFTSGEQFPASSQFAFQTYGVAHFNGIGIDQWALFKYMGDNDEDETGSGLASGDFMGQYDVDFANWTIQITSLTGDGFNWAGSNGDHFAYMILDLGGLDVAVGTMTKTTGATPATHTFPDLGFVAQGYSIASASDVSEDIDVNQAMRGSFGSFDGAGTGHSINAIVTPDVNTPRDSLSSSINVILMGQDFDGGNVQSMGEAQPIVDQLPQIIFDPNTNQAEIIGFYALASTGRVAGSIALTLTPAGTIRADAEISGSADLALTPAGNLRGLGDLAGNIPLVFTVDGVIAGGNSLIAGTVDILITPDGNLVARGELAGNAALLITPTATIRADAAISGSADLVLTPTATIRGIGDLAGTIPLVFTADGILVATSGVAGTIDLVITPAGDLVARGALAGSADLVITPAATLRGLGALAGSAALILTPSANLQGVAGMAGTVAMILTPDGTLQGVGALAGSAALAITPDGTIQARGELAGAAALAITPAGTVAGLGELSGAVALLLTPTGTIQGRGELLGSAALVITPTGDLVAAGGLRGVIPLTLVATGTLEALAQISGAASLVITPSGTLQATGGLLGSSALSFTLAGNLEALGALLGSSDLVLTPTGDLTGDGALAGTIPLTITPAGILEAVGELLGSVDLVLTPTGILAGMVGISGSIPLTITAAGNLAGAGALAGSAALVFDVAGNARGVGPLAGVIPITLDAAGALVARGTLAGSLSLILTPTGTIVGLGALAGAAALVFTPTGTLVSEGKLSGSIDITIDAQGAMIAKALAQGSIDMTLTPAGVLQGMTAIQGSAALTISADGTLRGVGDLAGLAELAFTLSGIMFDQGARRIPNSLQSFIVFLDNSRQDLATGTDNATQIIDGAFNSIQTIEAGVTNSSQ